MDQISVSQTLCLIIQKENVNGYEIKIDLMKKYKIINQRKVEAKHLNIRTLCVWKRTSSLDIYCLYNLIPVFIKVYNILQKSYQPYFKILTINNMYI